MNETLENGGMGTADLRGDSNAVATISADTSSTTQEPGHGHSIRSAQPVPGVTVAQGQPSRVRLRQRRPAPPFPPPTGCQRVVLPLYGFVLDADDDHRERVDRFFQVPMLVFSLLVLPILAGQYYFSHRLNHPWVPYLLEAAFLLVSIAFLVEFVIKVTIARSRWRYALANWLDIVIIVLPFLRPFRAARALRVAQLLPAYSFRGVYGKFIRSAPAVIMGMKLVRRMRQRFAPPGAPSQTRPDYAQWSKAALIAEIQRLHQQLRELRRDPPQGA